MKGTKERGVMEDSRVLGWSNRGRELPVTEMVRRRCGASLRSQFSIQMAVRYLHLEFGAEVGT